jgi:hypothetical protein
MVSLGFSYRFSLYFIPKVKISGAVCRISWIELLSAGHFRSKLNNQV